MKQLLTVEDVEVVFNLAVVPLPTSLERTIDTNVAMTTVVCELLREGYYQDLIQSSSKLMVPLNTCPWTRNTVDALDALMLLARRLRGSYWKTFAAARLSCDRSTTSVRGRTRSLCGIILIVIQRALQVSPLLSTGWGRPAILYSRLRLPMLPSVPTKNR